MRYMKKIKVLILYTKIFAPSVILLKVVFMSHKEIFTTNIKKIIAKDFLHGYSQPKITFSSPQNTGRVQGGSIVCDVIYACNR